MHDLAGSVLELGANDRAEVATDSDVSALALPDALETHRMIATIESAAVSGRRVRADSM